MKRSLYTLLFLTGLIITVSCNKSGDSITPEVRDITESVYASGVIKAAGQHDVFATTSGILKQILVQEGDSIAMNTALFVIDNAVSQMSAANAELALQQSKGKTATNSATLLDLQARVRLAKARMENDSLLLERQRSLWAQQVGSKLELEKRELAFQTSSTEYESLSLQFRQLQSDLSVAAMQAENNYRISLKHQDDYTIRSSLNGRVFAVLREPGELVTPQLPLAVIGEDGSFEIELQVDEYDIVKVEPGQRVFVSMDSYRSETFEAAVTRIEPLMNERTRTFTVYAAFTKAPVRLYPNLTVEANILIRTRKNALTIPVKYLLGGDKVLIAPDETTTVKVGAADLNYAEIVDGIGKETTIYLPGQ